MVTAQQRLDAIRRTLAKINKTAEETFVEAELHGDAGSKNAEYQAAMNRLEGMQEAVEEAAVKHIT